MPTGERWMTSSLRGPIVEWFRRTRRGYGTQLQLATALRGHLNVAEISDALISSYESGNSRIPADVLVATAMLAQRSLDDYFGIGEEESEPPTLENLHRRLRDVETWRRTQERQRRRSAQPSDPGDVV